jgi:MYXO-CTERM domain-containing protein
VNLPTLSSVTVDWNVRGQAAQSVPLTQSGDKFTGSIPAQPDGTVIQYKVTYTLSNGSSLSFPTGNPAEPYLEFYVGSVRPIACFDFESGAQGWTGDATGQWKAGTPLGLAGDPNVAHGGTGVFGLDIDEDGTYVPDSTTSAESPEIDLKGATKVRLQYHRWLNVEMGIFEQARIFANGVEVWTNAGTPEAPSQVNFTDKEWRFSDIDLGAQAASGKVKLRFELTSDSFLELGGWTLDDVCIVEAVAPGCGNGVVEANEQCDDGNVANGDGCSATCQSEDPTEPPDGDDGGCCSAGGSPMASFGLGAFVLGLALRRRKRRS